MIYHAVHQPWPVIDITPSNRIIHQNHDYRHLPDGVAHYDLEESYQNVNLAGGMRTTYDLLDVPLVFEDGRIKKKRLSLPRILTEIGKNCHAGRTERLALAIDPDPAENTAENLLERGGQMTRFGMNPATK